MTVGPGWQGGLHERLGATGEKRTQREHQHLIEAGGGIVGRARVRIGSIDAGGRVVPPRQRRLEQVGVASDRDNPLVVSTLKGFEPLQDVGCLAQCEPEVGPVERDVCEADDRTARRILGPEPFRVGLQPWQRHTRLNAALHFDERHLHVNRGRQLRLRELQLLELDDLARFGSRRPWRAFGHA